MISRRRLRVGAASLFVSAWLVVGAAWAAGAASVPELLTEAQAAWGKRDATLAVDRLSQALVLARKQAPLRIRAALPVDELHGLGVYSPAKGGVLKGRLLQLYVEIENFGTEPIEDRARVRLELSGTFSVMEGEGERKVLGKKTLGEQVYETRAPLGVAYLGTAIDLGSDFEPGTYHVELKVKDLVSAKVATQEVVFVIR